MKAKTLILVVTMALLAATPAFAQRRGVTTGVTGGGRTVVGNHYHRPYCRGGGVSWSVGIGFPFYGGGYYGGYPYYGGYYPAYGGYYPYGGYGYGYYPSSGYSYSYGGGNYGAYDGRPAYGRSSSRGSTVARVQERLARAGYYRGEIDGVIGPRTRSAIRVYERQHGLTPDGAIDRQLLAAMGLA